MEEAKNVAEPIEAPKNEYKMFGEEFAYAAFAVTVASTFAILNIVQYIA